MGADARLRRLARRLPSRDARLRSAYRDRNAGHRDHHQPGRSTMHAVLIEVDVSGVEREAGLQGLRQQIVPAVSQLPGFQSGTWLAGNKEGKGLSLTLWDTEAN